LEGTQTLRPQLVTVTDEERAAELPGVGDLLQQMNGDKRLP